MNRKFDFRALLIKIQDRLSKDDRHRLHFLVGDLIPRMQRDDVTLAGTLTVLESLFDRAAVNEDDLDFLIRIFSEIQFYDAVKLLQEFKSPKELPKEPPRSRQPTLTEVFNDNIEDDKLNSTPYEHLTSEDSNSCSLHTPNVRKLTTTETLSIGSEMPDINNNPSSNNTPQQIEKTSFKSRMIYYLYIFFFLQIVGLLIYLWIYINKKGPVNIFEKRYTKDTYFLQSGTLSTGINGKWFNDSEDLSLTFADRLLRIDAYAYGDDLYSITFVYSQNKSITHELRNDNRPYQTTAPSIDLKEQDLLGISQCYKNNSEPTYLVGLSFQFKNTPEFRGSCSGHIRIEDSFPHHIFGFASGRKTEHLTGFQFIWYKICSYHSQIKSCEYYADELNSGFQYTD